MRRRRVIGGLQLTATLLVLNIHRTSDGREPPGRLHLKLSIEGGKGPFIVKEQVRVVVTLQNSGDGTLTVPEIDDSRNDAIEYLLTGPSFGAGLRTHYGKAEGRMPGAPEQVQLAPGESLDAPIDLGRFVGTWLPGAHTVQLRWHTLVSEVFRFEIQFPQLASAQIVSNGLESDARQIRVGVLAAGGRAYTGFFEVPSALSPAPPKSFFVATAEVPAQAQSLIVPAANFNRAILREAAIGWTDGKSLAMLAGGQAGGPPLAVEGARILRPGLLLRSGEVEIHTVNGLALSHWRLPLSGSPHVLATTLLPARVLSGAVAIGPSALNSPRAAVLVLDDEAGLSVGLVQDGRLRLRRFMGVRPLEGSQPALSFGADGRVRSCVLVGDRLERRRVQVLDLVWPLEADLLPLETGPAYQFMLPENREVAEACVSYAPRMATPRREWAALLDDGRLLSSRSSGASRMPPFAPVRPLQLAVTDAEAFLLCHHPSEVMALPRLE